MRTLTLVMLGLTTQIFAKTKLIEIPISSHDQVYQLTDFSIVNASNRSVKMLVGPQELERLKGFGYRYKILIDDYESYIADLKIRGEYHSYHELDSILNYYALQYPTICRLETIGLSVQGRRMFAMKISDDPSIDEPEPEVRLIGNMHGDEVIACEVPFYFLRYLLDNYSSSMQVRGLVDSIEYTIIPMFNPDGHEMNQRYNANGVDLNRDCGYFWEGAGSSPSPFSQIENRNYVAHNYQHNNLSIEYNYHSVAQYVNYVWDYHPHDPPDSAYIVQLSNIYANAANLSVINGYEWYQVCGSLQDASLGDIGALAWTIETLQPSNPAQIDQICYENRDALLAISQRAKWGISGLVTDSITGEPLWARIKVVSPERWNCYSDTIVGDYHKMLPSGSYDISFWAPGYKAKTISNVNIPSQGLIWVDCQLVPDSTQYYGFQVVVVKYGNHAENGNNTQPPDGLYAPDNRYFSLGRNGYIVIDMQRPIRNGPGNDFTVYEGDAGAEGYSVYVADDWSGAWHSLGSGSGTQGFDLASGGVNEARYVRINDDGSASSGPYAGYDLDAIEANYVVPGIESEVAKDLVGSFSVGPNPGSEIRLSYSLSRPSYVNISLFDASGRLASLLDYGFKDVGQYRFKHSGHKLPDGVYFLRFSTEGRREIFKFVIVK